MLISIQFELCNVHDMFMICVIVILTKDIFVVILVVSEAGTSISGGSPDEAN